MKRILKKAQFKKLIDKASVLEEVSYGVKVYLLSDRRVLKLFRLKRFFSGSFFYPYSFRFARNGRKLKRLGIPSISVEKMFYYPEQRSYGVIYPLIEGKTFSGLLDDHHREDRLTQLASFVVRLHELGIYFRSLHLGNVIMLKDGRLGLIDVADMRFKGRALYQAERVRNFRHLYRSEDHSGSLREYGYEAFVQLYVDALGHKQKYKARLHKKLLAANHSLTTTS